jgi:hypothetical protein
MTVADLFPLKVDRHFAAPREIASTLVKQGRAALCGRV